MKAARIHRFGSPDVIVIDDVDVPAPAADEVVVRVAASGVGPWDAWIRRGQSVLEQPLPLTLGADLAGRVVSLGSSVRGLASGAEVFGVANARFTGANAEVAVVKAASVAPKPARTSFAEAAAIPVVGVTALQMVTDVADVRPGQRVLVHGAAGAVGSYAVQLARLKGAHVLGTAIGAGVDYVRSLGAAEVVDTSAARFDATLGSVDAVIDTVGGDLQSRSFSLLRRGGVLVSSVSRPDDALASSLGVRARFLLVDVTRRALEQLAELVEEGKLVGRIGVQLSLSDARRAHEMLEGLVPRPPGKIVLTSE